MSELRRLADQADDEHASDPAAAAERLERGYALLPGEAGDAEAFARVLEHVLLGHLDDGARLAGAIGRLQPWAGADEALAAVLQRAQLAIALTDSLQPLQHSALPAAERVRALYNSALARVRRGDWPAVDERIAAALALQADAGRACAAMMNNIAADLCDGLLEAHRGSERERVMLECAQRARDAWARVGGWVETERADYRLALCHAAAGRGAQALGFARACLERCEAEGADAFELLFAHEALLQAQLSAGDPQAAAAERAQIRTLLTQVDDADSRTFAEAYLASLPAMRSQ
jgi:hypothetical protein